MNAWTTSVLIAAAFIPLGIALALVLNFVLRCHIGQMLAATRGVMNSTPWHFYLAWTIMFGIWSWAGRIEPFRIYFGLMAAFEFYVMLQVLVRDRVQFRLSGLLVALTLCALWAAVYRVLGQDWIALTGVAAGVYSLLCLVYLWLRKLLSPERSAAKINS